MDHLRLPEAGGDCSFHFYTKKENGKVRHLAKPNRQMRKFHRRFLAVLMEIVSAHPWLMKSATGGLPGASPALNAAKHRLSRYFYAVDLKDAYRKVDGRILANLLHTIAPGLASQEELYRFVWKYCMDTRHGGLLMGAPASPMLFNIYCALLLDPLVRKFCKEGMVYTRYFDDLTISSKQCIPKSVRKKLREAVALSGFTLARHKAKLHDLWFAPVVITGFALWRGKKSFPAKLELKREFVAKTKELLDLPVPLMNGEDLGRLQGTLGYINTLKGFETTKVAPKLWKQSFATHRDVRHELARVRAQKHRQDRLKEPTMDQFGRRRAFPPGFIDVLRERVPFKHVIETSKLVYELQTASEGRELKGLCPFHNEKTPSFTVALTKGFFHCFGCGEHGDVISFVRKTRGLSFPEAINYLADTYGIKVP